MAETELIFFQETMKADEFNEFLLDCVVKGLVTLDLALCFKGEMKE
jgi:hypothetical protein